ncbi:MAG: DUF6941 family protein [Candidatus Omnitrophota bacterium]
MDKPKPIVLSMIICDTVLDDRATNKKTLVGLFSNIWASSCPCVHPRLNVFITLTDGRGSYQGSLKCVNEDTNTEILRLEGPIIFQSGEHIIELNFELVNVRFPAFGSYHFEFWCDGDILITRRFAVTQQESVGR